MSRIVQAACLICLLPFFSCKKDVCKEKVCENRGTCIEGTCLCAPGFTGSDCSIFIVSRFLGNYQASYNCNFASHDLAIQLKPGNEGNLVTIKNLGDYSCIGGDYFITGIAKSDTLIIERQNATCTQPIYEVEGIGIQRADSLLIDFSIHYTAGGTPRTDICKAFLKRLN